MRKQPLLSFATLLFLGLASCGRIPLISPNREGFPPWEKLPEGNGIVYLEKFTRDPGIDPLYLAKIRYDDGVALQRIVDTFGLVPCDDANDVQSFTTGLQERPDWFPLKGVTSTYSYPAQDGEEYVANLWVNANEKVVILERTWW